MAAGTPTPALRRIAIAFWVGACLTCSLGSSAAGVQRQTPFHEVKLYELPSSGQIAKQPVTLATLAGKYRAAPGFQAEQLLLYIWDVDAKWKPPVPPECVTELRLLDSYMWDFRANKRVTPVSIVFVHGERNAFEGVVRKVQQAAHGWQRIPTFVAGNAVPFHAALADMGATRLPAACLVTTDSLRMTAARGDDPVSAHLWSTKPDWPEEMGQSEPGDIPPTCRRSYFRRHIARAIRAGVINPGPDGVDPKRPVTDVEFSEWLSRVSPERAAGVLQGVDPAKPGEFTRERAITATVRFVYGHDMATALAASAPPFRKSGDVSARWEEAFGILPGAANAMGDLQKPLQLALARGLLYDQPALQAQWPLTVEVGAWLVCHALAPKPGSFTGLVIDAIDVPIEPDTQYGRGAIYVEAVGGSEAEDLYPQQESRLPSVPTPPVFDSQSRGFQHEVSYSSVHWAVQEEVGRPDSPEAGALRGRVGRNPLVVRATGVRGRGAKGTQVFVTPADAARIRTLNWEAGVLDDWKVAFLLGFGAQLVTDISTPVSRDTAFAVVFTPRMTADGKTPPAMDAATLTPDNVWVQRRDNGERAAVSVSWDGRRRELAVKPSALLAPGVTYDLVLGTGVKNALGQPLSFRDWESLPPGAARCWTFATEALQHVILAPVNAPAGTKITVSGAPHPYTLPTLAAIELRAPMGPLTLGIEHPGGRRQEVTVEIAGDGVLPVRTDLPQPGRLAVEGMPKLLTPGEPATITVRALDSAGAPMSYHAPVQVTLSPVGCEVSPGPWVTVAGGEATFTVRAAEPGRLRVGVSTTEPQVPCEPDTLSAYCTYVAPASARVWSAPERHRVPRPERGASDAVVFPRLRRWLAHDPAFQVTAVPTKGGEPLTRIADIPGLPSRNEFWVDRGGRLHFHASRADSEVDIRYEYRQGRCAALVAGLTARDSAAVALQELLGDLIGELGYHVVSPEALSGLWPGEDAGARLSGASWSTSRQARSPNEDAQLAMEVLGLSDIFLLSATAVGPGAYELSWTVWSTGERGVVTWSSRAPGSTGVRLAVNRDRQPPLDVQRAARDLSRALLPWQEAAGVTVSPTLVSD